ncbi:MAG TPA: DMT family transporter [Pyrinomonadaceae bacterium]|jgi:drug/metabolite transporter (DMT)-like permease
MSEIITENEKSYAPHVALVAVQVFFGSATVLGKFALLAFPPYALVGFRVGGATLAFYILQRFRGSLALDCSAHYLKFAIFALIGVALNQLLFFKGLSLTTAVNTSLIAVTIPIFTILISALIGSDRLSWRKGAGIVLAAAGVIYLINPGKASFGSETTQGDVLIVLNSLCYAIYVAISKKLISHYGALKSIAWLFLYASLINVPMGVFALRDVNLREVSLNSWLFVAGLVIFPTIMAYFWNAWALSRVEPSVVAVYIYLQPLMGFLAAILFLGEHFSVRLLVSASLVFAGVFLVTKKKFNARAQSREGAKDF